MKGTFSDIVYWNTMIIVHLICIFLLCLLSFFFENYKSVIFCNSCNNIFESVKKYIKFHSQLWSTSALENEWFPLNLRSKHTTLEQLQGRFNYGGLDLNTVLNLQIQVNYPNTLLYPVSVIDCTSPGRALLCILIGDLTSKISLLLITLLSESKTNLKNCSVTGNHIEFS